MFLPFQTSLSMWFAAQPVYELEPDPATTLPLDATAEPPSAPDAPPPGTAAADGGATATASTTAASPPATTLAKQRLVFKGIEWRAFQVRHVVENPAWALASQNRKDEDEARGQPKARPAAVRPPEVQAPLSAADKPPAD